uniref:mRNA-decapping enzyme-like protein n=1 Tax=Arundo donax TaxID=35708 RepID=A0A0A9D4J9_ARUDO
MNHLNTENLAEDLLTDFEYQVQVPYVMYRNAADEITGIWFYNPQECGEVAHLFNRIKYAYSRASPKANRSSKSVFEELEAASGPSAVPAAEDTLEQPTSPTMVLDDINEFVAAISKADACADDMIGGTGTVRSNQSFRTVPSPTHESHSASASQPSAFHYLLPSRTLSVPVRPFDASQTLSVPVRPFDAHISHNSATIQPASLVEVKPALLAPMASAQTTMASAASSLSIIPPSHPPLGLHQPQSAPLHQPFPLSTASPPPLYGMPLLQPFPPPKPSPLLTPAASYGLVLTRDQVKGALLRLVQNDNFIHMIYQEMVKRPYP